MSSCVIESAVRRWEDTLKHTEVQAQTGDLASLENVFQERFAVQSTQISAVDAVLSRQRKIIGSVQVTIVNHIQSLVDKLSDGTLWTIGNPTSDEVSTRAA